VDQPLGSPAHQALIAHVVHTTPATTCPPPTWSRPGPPIAASRMSRGGSTPSPGTPSTRRNPWPAGGTGKPSRPSSGSAGRWPTCEAAATASASTRPTRRAHSRPPWPRSSPTTTSARTAAPCSAA